MLNINDKRRVKLATDASSGESATLEPTYECAFGFTVDNVVRAAWAQIARVVASAEVKR